MIQSLFSLHKRPASNLSLGPWRICSNQMSCKAASDIMKFHFMSARRWDSDSLGTGCG